MNEPPNRWNPSLRPETPPPAAVDHAPPPARLEEFPRPRVSTSPPPPPLSLAETEDLELEAIVGTGSSFSGTLSFAGHARIDGDFEGVARGGALLVVGQGARVRGRIEAAQVIILGGKVEADIVALRSIELYVPAEVAGDMHSPQIYIERGVQFQGACDMSREPPLALAPTNAGNSYDE